MDMMIVIAFMGLGLSARGLNFVRDVHSFVVTWRFQWRDDLPCRGMVSVLSNVNLQ